MIKTMITLDGGRNWYTREETSRIGDLLQLAGKWEATVQALDDLDTETREAASMIAPCSCGRYLEEYTRLHRGNVVVDLATDERSLLATIADSLHLIDGNTLREVLNNIIYARLEGRRSSAWLRGVAGYARELIDDDYIVNSLADIVRTADGCESRTALQRLANRVLLSGASTWYEYSYGGCASIYDEDIARRVCTPSELKRSRSAYGWWRRPNSRETWLDVQARALALAATWITQAIASLARGTY